MCKHCYENFNFFREFVCFLDKYLVIDSYEEILEKLNIFRWEILIYSRQDLKFSVEQILDSPIKIQIIDKNTVLLQSSKTIITLILSAAKFPYYPINKNTWYNIRNKRQTALLAVP